MRDRYAPSHRPEAATDPTGPSVLEAASAGGPGPAAAVIKGGSWLCAPNFCARYRPSARQPQELSLGASHVGFRTVRRERPPG